MTQRTPIEFLEADFVQVLDASPLSLLVIQRGELVYANARFLRAIGLPIEQAVGIDPSRTIIDPQMRETARERVRKAEAGEPQAPLVYQTIRGDGAKVWARIESTPCIFRGRPASLSIAQDVTDEVVASLALRESEERYLSLIHI